VTPRGVEGLPKVSLEAFMKCPVCYESRRRFLTRGWFMRHLMRKHGLSSCAALNYWFDACGQSNFEEILSHEER